MIEAKIFGLTDMGCVRTNNEDTFQAESLDGGRRILAVAIDGVGGYEGGEVAAEIARDTISRVISATPDSNIIDAMMQANNAVYEQRALQPALCEMSCVATAVLADLPCGRFSFAHIGDSRLYQYVPESPSPLVKLSHDQSLVGYQEEQGILTEHEAMNHPQRNIISQILGQQELTLADRDEFIDHGEFPIIPGSTLLLCSDGLTDMIDSHAIIRVLGNDQLSPEQQAQMLVDAAKAAGGRDNVTVVLVRFGAEYITIADSPLRDSDPTPADDTIIILDTDDTDDTSATSEISDTSDISDTHGTSDSSEISDTTEASEPDTSMLTAAAVFLGIATVATMLTVIALIV